MTPRLNPRHQGELGELSAMEWLSWNGAIVFTPVGHSPDVDLIADFGDGPIRIEVKTSIASESGRWIVKIATAGGNQSWSGVVKHFDPNRCDYLFVHVGDGRRWLIPAAALDCRHGLTLGGPKYSEFEIAPGKALTEALPLDSRTPLGECQSGQMERAVNASSFDYAGSNPASPIPSKRFRRTRYERKLGQSGQAVINQKRRVTLPQSAVESAGFQEGDRLRVTAAGVGRVVIEKVELPAVAEPA